MPVALLDYSKGKYYNNQSPWELPKGFVRILSNIYPHNFGNLRKRFALVDSFYQVPGVSVTPATYGLGMDDWNFTELGSGPAALASAVYWNPQRATAPGLGAINKPNGSGGNFGTFAFPYSKPAFAEYNGIIYASTTSHQVRKITALNFNTNAITEAIIASSPNLAGILSFKNRLFGWINNRVHFTDVPGAGLLPETWNTAANFFDVGSSKGTPVIKNILPVENRLYIFTDSGLFSVLISGPASTWIQRSVDETVRIDDRAACFVHKNIMYFVDRESIWATDGVEFKEIGEAVKAERIGNYGVGTGERYRIFRSDNTIIYSRRSIIAGTASGSTYLAELDTLKWWDLGNFTDVGIATEIHGTLNNIATLDRPYRDSFIAISFMDTTFEKNYIFVKHDPTTPNLQDNIQGSVRTIKPTLETGWIDFGEPLKYKSINYLLIEVSNPRALSTQLDVRFMLDGVVADEGPVTTVIAGAVNYNQILLKIEGPEKPFRWMYMTIYAQDQLDIGNVWMDYTIHGDIEPQVYNTI